MIVLVPMVLLPLVGLVIAVSRQSFAARVLGVSLAALPAGFGILMIMTAHRLATEAGLVAGGPPSQEFQRGVEAMERVTDRAMLVLLTGFLSLTLIGLKTDPARDVKDVPSRRPPPGS